MIGLSISHYRVTEKIGAGGMGEVYRATDTKLGRDVALKVLPPEFTADAMRMQRFQREAQLLAALNHPNIAAIYGLEDAGSHRALVMELVAGITLADRIALGALPMEEALTIARQIAEALEYAHERGIIHRDLKPANVKLTPDGAVKVLDFGLAKAMADDVSASLDLAQSPTLSLAATKAGIILGTAAYMSPEQAKGKPVDRRADIWSFGVVLHEMLTGQQLYTGETVSETMAHVITQTPSLDSLPAATPLRIRHLLQRCLTKDPRARLRDIGEARIAIEQAIANPADASGITSASGSAVAIPVAAPQPLWRRALPWAMVAVFALAAVLALWKPWQPPPAPPASVRLSAEIGADANLIVTMGASAIISPDGRRMVYLASPGSGVEARRLYVRSMDQLEATLLSGTENARHPFFSPDSHWIAFFADGKLKKIAASGGAAVTLSDAAEDRGGSWGDDGYIIFAGEPGGPLLRVSAAGGKPEHLTQLDKASNQMTHRWPHVLPGSKAVLFISHNQRTGFDQGTIMLYVLGTKQYKQLLTGGSYARYLPSGHVMYMHEGTLFAVPFDLEKLEVTGESAPAVEQVVTVSGNGGAQYSFSDRGDLVFVKGTGLGEGWQIQWLNAKGETSPLRPAQMVYFNPAFSPDGTRLAIQTFDKQNDIQLYDWKRDTLTRMTFAAQHDMRPAWTPDGRWLAFTSDREGPPNLYAIRSDGSGEPIRLTKSTNPQTSSAWHPSGKFLVFTERNPQGSLDLMLLPVEWNPGEGPKPGTPSVLLSTTFGETDPAFSPDGRWLAYTSNESGEWEIFVRPFPAGEGKWQVSSGGGGFAMWSKISKELFYRAGDANRVMVATYRDTAASFQVDKPRVWSNLTMQSLGGNRTLDLHPDGKRFAILRTDNQQSQEKRDKIVIVQNFFDELRRIAPPTKP